MGWNMYMHPDDAARGYLIFKDLPQHNEDIGGFSSYPDLTEQAFYKDYEGDNK